jgi:hypothetical protein
MFKRRLITTVTGLAGVALGSTIDHLVGFQKSYIAIVIASILAFYWIVEFVFDIVYFYMFYDDEFNLWIAQKVNRTTITYEEIQAKRKYYLKQFKRSRRKNAFSLYMRLIFAMGVFIFFVINLF